MAIVKMKKLLFLISQREEEIFLQTIQKMGIVHIDKTTPEEISVIENKDSLSDLLDKFDDVIKILSKYNPIKKGNKELIANSGETENIIEETLHFVKKLSSMEKEQEKIAEKLLYWDDFKGIDVSSKDFYSDYVNAFLIKTEKEIAQNPETFVLQNLKTHVYIAIVPKNEFESFKLFIDSINAEIVNIEIIGDKKIDEYIAELENKINDIKKEEEVIKEKIKKFASKLPEILVQRDIIATKLKREEARELALKTDFISLYSAWVPKEMYNKVKDIEKEFSSLMIIDAEQEEKEQPPVALKNKKLFEPFEVVTDMYGTPSYNELDPSSYLSIFFVIFFGLTLTDAGYGIILTGLTIWLMKKMPEAKKFLKLMMWGGIFTIIEGAMLGGWFGDLFKNIGTEYASANSFSHVLNMIYHKTLWFDPMDVPMNFFKLSLAVGLVQIIFGLGLGLYKTFRQKDWGAFLFDYLTWFLMLLSLLSMMFSSDMMEQFGLANGALIPEVFGSVGGYMAMFLAVVIVLFAARHEKSWGMRLFMGILNLTILNGITSYFGDVLSYIRLMALGLVTAGIGMAINVIAFMTMGIPYVGWLITLVILILGHTFNIAINVLGGFVHTLRLQYVEFFQKFFEGGGRRFKPLKEEKRYSVIQ